MTDAIDDLRHDTDLHTDLRTDVDQDVARARQKATNLRSALESSRTIAVAIGITMERLQLDQDRAFDLLRRASQHDHRKIRDIAADIVFSGELPRVGA